MRDKLFKLIGLLGVSYLIFNLLFPVYIMHKQDKEYERLMQELNPASVEKPLIDARLGCDASYEEINTENDLQTKYLKCVNPTEFKAIQNYHKMTKLILYADAPVKHDIFPELANVKYIHLIGPYWEPYKIQINSENFPNLTHIACSDCGFDITTLAKRLQVRRVTIGHSKVFSNQGVSKPQFYNLNNLAGMELKGVLINPGKYQRFQCDQLASFSKVLEINVNYRDREAMNEFEADYISRCYSDYQIVEKLKEEAEGYLSDGNITKAVALAERAFLGFPVNQDSFDLWIRSASKKQDHCTVVNLFEGLLVLNIIAGADPEEYRFYYQKSLVGFQGGYQYSKSDLEQRRDLNMRSLCENRVFKKLEASQFINSQFVGGLKYVQLNAQDPVKKVDSAVGSRRVLADKLAEFPFFMDRNNRVWFPAERLPVGTVMFAVVNRETGYSVRDLKFSGYCGRYAFSSKMDAANSQFRTPVTIVEDVNLSVAAVVDIKDLDQFPTCYFALEKRPSIEFALQHKIQIYREKR